MDSVSEKIHAETSGETVELGATDPYEDSEPFLKLEQKIDIAYTIVGIGAAVLILFGYLRILRETPNLQKKDDGKFPFI